MTSQYNHATCNLYTASLVSLKDALIGWSASDYDAPIQLWRIQINTGYTLPSPTWRASPTWRKQKAFPLPGTAALWVFKKKPREFPEFVEAADSLMLADMGRETVYVTWQLWREPVKSDIKLVRYRFYARRYSRPVVQEWRIYTKGRLVSIAFGSLWTLVWLPIPMNRLISNFVLFQMTLFQNGKISRVVKTPMDSTCFISQNTIYIHVCIYIYLFLSFQLPDLTFSLITKNNF